MNDYVDDLLLRARNHYAHSAGLRMGSKLQKDHSNHYQEAGVSAYNPRLDRPKFFFH